MMRRTTGLAIAALALTLTSACGGSSSDEGDAASDAATSSTPTASAPTSTDETPAAPAQTVDPDERPTVKQLATTLKTAGLTDAQATCFGKALDKSDLSDKLLAALVNQDTTFKPSEKDTATYEKVGQEAGQSCQ